MDLSAYSQTPRLHLGIAMNTIGISRPASHHNILGQFGILVQQICHKIKENCALIALNTMPITKKSWLKKNMKILWMYKIKLQVNFTVPDL